MNTIAGNDVYTVIHFIRKNNNWIFAGFQGVFANIENAEKAINANALVKEKSDDFRGVVNDYFRLYQSKDGNHRWELSKTIVR